MRGGRWSSRAHNLCYAREWEGKDRAAKKKEGRASRAKKREGL